MNNKIASISAIYETKRQEKQNEKNRLIAINSSNGLFINARTSTNQPANGNTTASTSVSDGASRVRLSESDGRFLINIASDADQIVNQLSECQAIVYADREVQP